MLAGKTFHNLFILASEEHWIQTQDINEWKLVDGIDLIVHIFHPEKRKFYELEKMWSELIPKEKLII